MKKSSRKMTVFWTIHITLAIYLLICIFFAKEYISVIASIIIPAQIINGAVYITGNVADAWQLSNNYKWQLDPGMKSEKEKVSE